MSVNGVAITYNAAVNKQSFQSSVYSDDQRSYPASLANDGHRDPPRSPHCAVTESETNPWWAVDLGEPTTVSRVDLTITAESGQYMQCFSECGRSLTAFNTIRYDTIGEFNVDWKAEYSALYSTRSQKKKLKQPTPVPL